MCPQPFGYSAWSQAGFQALAKPVPGGFAAQWCPEFASESLVYPAVTAMMMGWKSACGVLQHARRRLCFARTPAGAGLPADSEIRRDRALPQTASGQLGSLVTIYLGGVSLAELSAVHQQAVGGTMSPEVAACRKFGVNGASHRKKRRLSTAHEWETSGWRVAGTLGLALPRGVISEQSLGSLCGSAMQPAASKSFRSWMTDGRDAFNFDEKQSCAFLHLWSGIYPSARPHKPCRCCASTCATASSPPTRQKQASASSDPPRSRSKAATSYHCVRCQQPLLVTSWASSSSTPASVASGDQRNFSSGYQVCTRLQKMIQPAAGCSKRRGPTQSRLPQVVARSIHIAQLVQSASHVTIWLIGGTMLRVRCLTKAHSAVPRAKKASSFIILDGSQAWSAQQHPSQGLQLRPTVTHP